jgi:hypothetical protein
VYAKGDLRPSPSRGARRASNARRARNKHVHRTKRSRNTPSLRCGRRAGDGSASTKGGVSSWNRLGRTSHG